MAECTDKRFADMLHAYELDLLADEDRRQMEVHLLECVDCFERVKSMAPATDLLNRDDDVRSVVGILASAEGTEPLDEEKPGRTGEGSRKTNFNRYLLAAALTICIALPGYYVLFGPASEPEVVQELTLLPMRSTTSRVLSLDVGGVADISFVLEDASPDHRYSVAILRFTLPPDTVYMDAAFIGFNERGLGTIRLPMSEFEAGLYTLTIEDPANPDAGTLRQYSFKVE